jgi:formylglycine-generating enzyme required for sulfatase activity
MPTHLFTLEWSVGQPLGRTNAFLASRAGDERAVGGVRLCSCLAGRLRTGSPPDEPKQRPGEAQVEVTLSKGLWIGKCEVTQGQWKRVVGESPGRFTAGEGDGFPVYTLNFAEAERFGPKLTESAHASGELPKEWELFHCRTWPKQRSLCSTITRGSIWPKETEARKEKSRSRRKRSQRPRPRPPGGAPDGTPEDRPAIHRAGNHG